MKRVFSLLLIASFTVIGAVGCNKDKDVKKTETVSSTSTAGGKETVTKTTETSTATTPADKK